MDSEHRQPDVKSATALVKRIVCELDRSTLEQRDLLLCDLLCVAWPSRWAQDQ